MREQTRRKKGRKGEGTRKAKTETESQLEHVFP
jgi:hypothetical protein